MLIRTAFITFVCSLSILGSYGQKKVKTNLEIFDKIISEGLEKFLYHPDIDRKSEFVFIINPGSSSKFLDTKADETGYLKSIVKKKASEERLNFSFIDSENKLTADSVHNVFIMKSIIMSTKYNGFSVNKFLGEKLVNRDIKVKISVDITGGSNADAISDFILSDYHDEVNIDDIEHVESAQYSFSHDTTPETGEFESVIFPALLIAVSAAATLLFFFIRTK